MSFTLIFLLCTHVGGCTLHQLQAPTEEACEALVQQWNKDADAEPWYNRPASIEPEHWICLRVGS